MIKDTSRQVICRETAQEDIMRGEDEPGKLRIYLIPGDIVDINRASERELALLPHVGEVIAGRIIAYRENIGPFTDIRQLMEIEGIGEAVFERIAPMVCTGEPK
ncbi:MAG: helix-hairpin-helix domain-containing protein [Oscillospiraceae bacterium]|nr:helix-hairpin-helix domain-containing protein [Oscillospiraceae bacterium]